MIAPFVFGKILLLNTTKALKMQQYMKVILTLEFKIPQNGEDPEKWLMPIIYANLEKNEEVTSVSTQYTLWKEE